MNITNSPISGANSRELSNVTVVLGESEDEVSHGHRVILATASLVRKRVQKTWICCACILSNQLDSSITSATDKQEATSPSITLKGCRSLLAYDAYLSRFSR